MTSESALAVGRELTVARAAPRVADLAGAASTFIVPAPFVPLATATLRAVMVSAFQFQAPSISEGDGADQTSCRTQTLTGPGRSQECATRSAV